MAEITKIEWCDSTFNPVVGCTKIKGPRGAPSACDFCYADTWAKRTGHPELWNGERRRTSAALWKQPIKWNANSEQFVREHGHRQRVFCASLADVFDNQWEPKWRLDLFYLIRSCGDLDFLLLTKRPQNIRKMLPADWGDGWPNVWLGTTTENQAEYNRRWDYLREVPARVRFVSYEPALGPLSVVRRQSAVPDWVIAGGESGGNARPSDPDWFRDLRDECAQLGIPYLFKQWGEHAPYPSPIDPSLMKRVGKKTAGRLLDGVQHDGYPTQRGQ